MDTRGDDGDDTERGGPPGQEVETGPAPPDPSRHGDRRPSPYNSLSGLGRVSSTNESENFIFLGPDNVVYRLMEYEDRTNRIVPVEGLPHADYVTLNTIWSGAIVNGGTFRYFWTPDQPWDRITLYDARIVAEGWEVKAVVRWVSNDCYFLLWDGSLYRGELPLPEEGPPADERMILRKVEVPRAEMILNSQVYGEMVVLGLDRRSLFICYRLGRDEDDVFDNIRLPVDFYDDDEIAQIAAADHAYGFVGTDGRVATWGRNRNANLGHGHTGEIHFPRFIPNVTHAVGLGICGTHIAIVRVDGSVVAAGANGVWIDGDPVVAARRVFSLHLTPIPNITDAIAVYCKNFSTTIIHRDGRVTLFRRNIMVGRNEVFRIPPIP
jgi:hypothetical protein